VQDRTKVTITDFSAVVVSCGQLRAVVVSCGPLGPRCGELWPRCGQFRPVVVRCGN